MTMIAALAPSTRLALIPKWPDTPRPPSHPASRKGSIRRPTDIKKEEIELLKVAVVI